MRRLLLAVVLASASVAALAKSPQKYADEAVTQNLPAITIWVDATWGFRNKGAAGDLSEAHKAFYAAGYHLIDVQPYIENGDLQGFFVSYEKNR